MNSELLATSKESLDTAIFAELSRLNLNVDSNVLRDISSRIANENSTALVTNTYTTANGLMNSIPEQVIGPNNPVDVVSSNLTDKDLYNNLYESIDSTVTSNSNTNIINSIITELSAVLTPEDFATINTSENIDVIYNNLLPTTRKTVETSLSSYSVGVFENTQEIIPLTSGVEGLFDQLPIDADLDSILDALDKIDLNYSNSITDQALNEADQFDIGTKENTEKLVAVEKGFMDPSATYPTKDYSNQVETNKLARGEIKNTEVEDKNNNRITGIKLPYGNSFDEPESPYNAVYPYNKVTRTESGHLIEVDDTPGCERLHVYHKSGTYIEIDSNGSVVKRAKGSSYEIIDKNGKIAIRGQADISVNGTCNIFVGNDVNMEVIGNVNMTCYNEVTVQTGGNLNLTANDEINIHASNVNIEADNLLNILADGQLYVSSGNAISMTANTEFLGLSQEDFNLVSSKNIKLQSSENIDVLAAGDVNIDSSKTYINSGNATGANTAIAASTSNAGLISEGRRYVDYLEITDPEPLKYSSRITEKAEGFTPSDSELNKQRNELLTKGIVDREELVDPDPVVVQEESPRSEQDRIIAPDQKLLSVTELPGNYKLSPNFTLDMTWKKVAVSPGKHVLRAQRGLTYGQIVYNLQALALNVMEPVKKLYPDMVITSCFRHDTEYPNSPHSVGLAVDIQFPSASRAEYYNIAVKLAKVLKYDQILLEYWAQAKSPWIHIGLGNSGVFKAESVRNVAWTFLDHKLYKQSLVNLA